VVAFLYLWSGLWTIAGIVGLSIGDIFLNGHRYTPDQVQQFFGWAIFAGVLVILVGTRLLLGWLNERIVVTDRTIEWFDWMARKRLRARLSTVQHTQDHQVGYGITRTSVATDGGTLRFSSLVRGYFDLKLTISEYARNAKKTGEPLGGSWLPTYEPPTKVFRYRFGRFHLYSFFLLAMLAVMMYQPLLSYSRGEQFPFGSPLLPIIFGVLCLLTALRWNVGSVLERITLSKEGIVWYDWKGREVVQAKLAEITGVEEIKRYGFSILRIDTLGGGIRASSFLVGYGALMDEIKRIIESRKPVEQKPAPQPAGR
jgi:hypothetical protein